MDDDGIKLSLEHGNMSESNQDHLSHTKAIYCASAATTAIIVVSLVLAVFICPILQRSIRHLVIAFLVSLGAGCLAGDAIFHLLPHALNPDIHNFTKEDLHHNQTTDPHKIALLRSLVVICSIYLFYLFHLITHSFGGGHSHLDSTTADNPLFEIEDKRTSPSPNKSDSRKINTLVVMILVGDVIHSFNDGLAIGGSFSKSESDGLSTSLAVLFHEVPHVVGNFAILVSNKLTMLKSLLYQAAALSGMYVGIIIGSLLGTTMNLTHWIFAVTAGMFLFVALSEMLPELLHSTTGESQNKLLVILLQNSGIISGFTIMGILALFEVKIRHALSGH